MFSIDLHIRTFLKYTIYLHNTIFILYMDYGDTWPVLQFELENSLKDIL